MIWCTVIMAEVKKNSTGRNGTVKNVTGESDTDWGGTGGRV